MSILFAEWYRICELPGGNEAAFNHFILQLHQNGLLKGDDVADRFFRLLTVCLNSYFGRNVCSSLNHKLFFANSLHAG